MNTTITKSDEHLLTEFNFYKTLNNKSINLHLIIFPILINSIKNCPKLNIFLDINKLLNITHNKIK